MTALASMLWRRLDMPGHDACVLEQKDSGWSLQGVAVFRHPSGPARIDYGIECDDAWLTRSGMLTGTIGTRHIRFAIARRENLWTLDGDAVEGLDHLVDLDLGFTPSTNFLQLRRATLALNQRARLPVAWFDVDSGSLTELDQIYTRVGPDAFQYEAPRFGYRGLLELAPNGFIRRYPDLWEAER